MNLFRAFLLTCIAVIVGYTSVTIAHHGMGLLPIFFGDMATMTWPGQFNLDFLSFLLLAGIWISWRHHFDAVGILLGVITPFAGMPFVAGYLLLQSFKVDGDPAALLLGQQRAALR